MINIYYNLNKTFHKELSCFPQDKGKFNFGKLFLRLSQAVTIFLILAVSSKILSLPGISFSLKTEGSKSLVAGVELLNESGKPKLERPENIEIKATKNFNLLPLSTIKAKELTGEKSGQINFLILGTPGKDNPAPYLTDSIIVASLDLKNGERATLISIPRDFLVRIPGGWVTKINSLYILDKKKLKDLKQLELLEKTIKEITSLEINYFIVIDLDGFKKLIEALGGVKVFVEEPIFDPKFPTSNRGYETFIMPAGWQYLDGETASKYVRARHAKGNDYGRMARQQQIIEVLREKVTNLNILSDLPTLLEIERILSSHFETNLTKEEGVRILELIENLNKENIVYEVINPSTGLITSGSAQNLGFVQWPRAGQFNYSEIQQYIQGMLMTN